MSAALPANHAIDRINHQFAVAEAATLLQTERRQIKELVYSLGGHKCYCLLPSTVWTGGGGFGVCTIIVHLCRLEELLDGGVDTHESVRHQDSINRKKQFNSRTRHVAENVKCSALQQLKTEGFQEGKEVKIDLGGSKILLPFIKFSTVCSLTLMSA